MPGSPIRSHFGTPAACAAASRPASSPLTSATTSSYCASEAIVAGSPRMCISTAGKPSRATVGSISRSIAPPLTSLTTRAPSAASSAATAAQLVSTEIGARSGEARRACTTGAARRSSSSGETATAPGRVDTAPTSIMSAPAASSSRACAVAAAAESKRPPSENESGVTLRTPISSVRRPHRTSPSSSSDPSGQTRCSGAASSGGSAASIAAAVAPDRGWRAAGSISASGSRTKRRSPMRWCGSSSGRLGATSPLDASECFRSP
mmetsp:Transcript_17375/g.58457  ORF Transcript_17375/g.58457 Transcript_17375/m.58457 type:complete len:264 (-) Transcript_17375:334-1125(-)